ncbi:MAG: glycosyltransferase [Candidatus Eisenbacteria bacterium]|nr:glycosyltransferase [Candidatus Eisenbacteria bacterium]
MRRVCFFGAYDRAYPRNRVLREGLRRAGVDVLEACVRDRRAFRRYPALIGAFAPLSRVSDAVLVPEFRHKDMPLARFVAGRRPLIFDPLVSRHDTLIDDWKLHAPGSAQARWNRVIDRAAFALADRVLCDTWAHGALFETLGAERRKLRRVLVGAEDAFFAAPPPPPAPPVRLVYVGGFLPLHGVPTLIAAAGELERRASRVPEFRIQLVGRGIEFDEARALAEQLALERVDFTGVTSYADAPRVLADAHVALGAFGSGEKAGRVIPHKVFQGFASGRAVVTGDGEGLREVFTPGEHVIAVSRGDALDLADALERVIRDEGLRERMASAGRARALEIASPERIGESLRSVIEECGAPD